MFYGLVFTALGTLLLLCWKPDATSVLVAHISSLAACCLLAGNWLHKIWRDLPADSPAAAETEEYGYSEIWFQIIPFASALWVGNALGNLSPLVDRYMIVAFPGLEPERALSLVGQYHVARIAPAFMITIASMMASVFLPYLSRDWERGERAEVGRQLDFYVRVTGLMFITGATAFLILGPSLFELLFQEKFAAGISVLDLALLQAVVFSMFCMARLYLWCSETGWLVNSGLVVALVANVTLNLFLLPRYGLSGAALASAAAAAVLLAIVYACAAMRGMRISGATILVSLMPATLLLGPLPAAAVLVATTVLVVFSNVLFDSEEKQQVINAAKRYLKFPEPWRATRNLAGAKE
jgi:O-antigen/teichoic acid export membrane protein